MKALAACPIHTTEKEGLGINIKATQFLGLLLLATNNDKMDPHQVADLASDGEMNTAGNEIGNEPTQQSQQQHGTQQHGNQVEQPRFVQHAANIALQVINEYEQSLQKYSNQVGQPRLQQLNVDTTIKEEKVNEQSRQFQQSHHHQNSSVGQPSVQLPSINVAIAQLLAAEQDGARTNEQIQQSQQQQSVGPVRGSYSQPFHRNMAIPSLAPRIPLPVSPGRHPMQLQSTAARNPSRAPSMRQGQYHHHQQQPYDATDIVRANHQQQRYQLEQQHGLPSDHQAPDPFVVDRGLDPNIRAPLQTQDTIYGPLHLIPESSIEALRRTVTSLEQVNFNGENLRLYIRALYTIFLRIHEHLPRDRLQQEFMRGLDLSRAAMGHMNRTRTQTTNAMTELNNNTLFYPNGACQSNAQQPMRGTQPGVFNPGNAHMRESQSNQIARGLNMGPPQQTMGMPGSLVSATAQDMRGPRFYTFTPPRSGKPTQQQTMGTSQPLAFAPAQASFGGGFQQDPQGSSQNPAAVPSHDGLQWMESYVDPRSQKRGQAFYAVAEGRHKRAGAPSPSRDLPGPVAGGIFDLNLNLHQGKSQDQKKERKRQQGNKVVGRAQAKADAQVGKAGQLGRSTEHPTPSSEQINIGGIPKGNDNEGTRQDIQRAESLSFTNAQNSGIDDSRVVGTDVGRVAEPAPFTTPQETNKDDHSPGAFVQQDSAPQGRAKRRGSEGLNSTAPTSDYAPKPKTKCARTAKVVSHEEVEDTIRAFDHRERKYNLRRRNAGQYSLLPSSSDNAEDDDMVMRPRRRNPRQAAHRIISDSEDE